jgi:hypothetical protein
MTSKLAYSRNRWILSAAIICLLAPPINLLAQIGNPPASLFIFPRFFASGPVNSGIAIFNPSGRTAVVSLTLTDSVGHKAGSATITIPALGQTAKTATELFGPDPKGSVLQVSSDIPGLVAYYQAFDADLTFMDGADAPESGSDLIFPVIPGPFEGGSEVSLLNTNPRATAVELNLWSFGGSLLGTATVQVPATGNYINWVDDIFPPQTDFSGASHIIATAKPTNLFSQAQPVSGTSMFFGFSSVALPGAYVDTAALNAVPLTRAAGTGVIPYFRVGAQYATTFSIATIEPSGVEVTLTAVGNDGSTLGTRRLSLKPHGGVRDALQNLFPALAAGESQGWLLIQATGRVYAAVIYGRADAQSLTAIPMQSKPKFEMVFPQIVQDSSASTEVAIVNPAAVSSLAELTVVSPDGVAAGFYRVLIPPGARISDSLDHWIPELASQSGGYIYLRGNQALFASASIWSANGATATSLTPGALSVAYYPPALKSFAVTGRVTLNGRPASGFRVVLSGPAGRLTTSDATGSYAFTQLPAGRYSMSVDQYGFQFLPAQTNFVLSDASKRQDFQGFTSPDAIAIQPPAVAIGSLDTTLTVYGRNFSTASRGYAGLVRLETTFVEPTVLRVVVPAYLLAAPNRIDIAVAVNDQGPDRKVTQPYALMVYQDRPVLASVTSAGEILEGSMGTTLTLRGSGFLPGASVTMNGVGDGIQVTLLDEKQILAYFPSQYFERGGIFPVTVVNPYPANVQSNIQLVTVFFPSPAVQEIAPKTVPARLEPGAGPMAIELIGYGFRRGAIVLFNGVALKTTYCEDDPYCLAVHLYAEVPAALLNQSGFASIMVQNPTPSLASSETVFLEINGLQPTITSVLPGSATALALPFAYKIPVVVQGTNFGPQTMVRIYQPDSVAPSDFVAPTAILSSTQLYATITVSYPASLGEWRVEVANPPPGGGKSQTSSFLILEGLFVANPFMIAMTPDTVAAGGPGLTLTIDGTNFQGSSQVYFNNILLNTVGVSDRQIMADIPAHLLKVAGRVPIRVTNPDNGGSSNRLYLDIR